MLSVFASYGVADQSLRVEQTLIINVILGRVDLCCTVLQRSVRCFYNKEQVKCSNLHKLALKQ